MIAKLSQYIDHESFLSSLSQAVLKREQIIMDLFVSNTCNLHCKHCYFLDYAPQGEPLTLQKWIDIINDCINVGIRHFHFSGKEPLCDQRIPLLLNHLNQLSKTYKLKYGFVTNGTLLNKKRLQELIESNISYIEFSLEGDMEYNRGIRGVNSFDSIYSMIKYLSDKSKLNITSTYFGNNIYHIEEMVNKFVNIGITKFNIAPYLKYENNVLAPVEELDYNILIDLVNHFHHYLKDNLSKAIDIRICVSSNQALKMFTHKNELTDDINQYVYNGKKIIYEIGNNVLEVNFPLLYIPYLTQMIITHDGIIIPCADDIHYNNLKKISIGKIGDLNMESILAKRKEFIYNYINQKLRNEKN